MKKILLLICFTLFLQSCNAKVSHADENKTIPLVWLHNLDKALVSAKQTDKKVLMMYSAPWCPECNYMKEVVFSDQNLTTYMKKNFVLLSFEVEKDTLPKGFTYHGIPTFFFLDGNKKEIGKIEGSDRATGFLKKLEKIQ